jgi:4-diphosphocytidyl-2-C-methyl-D-erythritol kinase
MAGRLGSDCPFFIFKQPMVMIGRGDEPFKTVELEERAFLLVIPPFGISTPEVYSKFTPLTQGGDTLNIYNNKIHPESLLRNDLEVVVFNMHPELAGVKKQLIDSGALGSLMSGSGSALFGIFKDHEHLLNSMNHLKKREGYRYIPTTRFN